MRLWTCIDLINQSRLESGLRGSEYHDTADWRSLVNRAIAQAWKRLTQADVGYGVKRATLPPCTVGLETLPLPSDHWQTRLLLRPTDGTTTGSRRKADRTTEIRYLERYPDDTPGQVGHPGCYWYRPEQIVLRPVPTVAEVLTMVYIPAPPLLVLDNDTIDLVCGFEEAIISIAGGLAHQDGQRRQELLQKGFSYIENEIASWSSLRDRSTPDFIQNYQSSSGYGRGAF